MPELPRKELLVVLASALALAALLNVGADIWHIKYYQPGSERWSLNAYAFQQSGDRADVLFLGSSSTRVGVNANVVRHVLRELGQGDVEVFNVAQPASGVVTNQILLRDLIRSNGCPRLIQVEVSPAALNENSPWWPSVGEYAAARDIPFLLRSATSVERLNFVLISVLRGGMRFYDRIARPPDESAVADQLSRLGSARGDLTWDQEVGPGPPRRAIRRSLWAHRRRFWRDLHIGGATLTAMHRIAALADACSARLVLVEMPTLIPYGPREELNVRPPFLEAMHELTEPEHVVFRDVNTAPTGLTPGHFTDTVHLSLGGSIVLSEYLAREIFRPLLVSETF